MAPRNSTGGHSMQNPRLSQKKKFPPISLLTYILVQITAVFICMPPRNRPGEQVATSELGEAGGSVRSIIESWYSWVSPMFATELLRFCLIVSFFFLFFG